MGIVCIDNHVLIWGVRKEATVGQESMISRAELFLDYLEAQKFEIIVPCVVAGEFLVKVPAEKHTEVQSILDIRFRVIPFDSAAAACAAKIQQEHKNSGLPRGDTPREVLKADIQILATAITRKAGVLYTHDVQLTKLAEKYLTVKKLPELPKQQALF